MAVFGGRDISLSDLRMDQSYELGSKDRRISQGSLPRMFPDESEGRRG